MTSKELRYKDNYPTPPAAEMLRKDLELACTTHDDAFDFVMMEKPHSGNLADAEATLSMLDHYIGGLPQLTAGLAVLMRKASSTEMVERLAVLLKSFPDRTGEDAAVFGRVLAEDVGAQYPSIGALDAACARLRRTITRPLYIADVIGALESQSSFFSGVQRRLEALPSLRERLAPLVDKARTNGSAKRENTSLSPARRSPL